jgi:hypothetical protein
MIDPLETIIKWLAARMTGISGRAANKHRFTDGWTKGQKAASVHEDDINAALYGKVHEARVEVQLYGSKIEIVDLYRELVQLCIDSHRNEVVTSQGTALIYECMLGTGLTTVFDDDLNEDIGVVYLFAMIAQDAVSG